MTPLRIGTRGSQLALFQARLVGERVKSASGRPCEIVIIRTSGDRLQEAPLSEIGGKRLFVKEIEDSLLNGEVDLAVHSSKDMPAVLPEGLDVAAVIEREDPRDAIVDRIGDRSAIGDRRFGTGSVRRVAQLRGLFPGASFVNVRGNLDTRLRKLDAGDYDALVLAAAGLRRLGFGDRISRPLPVDECVPAPGQGIIAIEIRSDDDSTRAAVSAVNDADAAAALDAERAVVTALGGGCQMPIGAVALPVGRDQLELTALVASLDGTQVVRFKKTGARTDAAALGRDVARELIERGAASILQELAQGESGMPDPKSLRLT